MHGLHPPLRAPSFGSPSLSWASGWLPAARSRSRCPEWAEKACDSQLEPQGSVADVHHAPCARLPPPKLALAAELQVAAAQEYCTKMEARVPGTLVRRCSKADSEALSTADSSSTAEYSSGVSSSGSTCGTFSDRTAESLNSEGQRQQLHQGLVQGLCPLAGCQTIDLDGAGLVEVREAASAAALAASRKRHAADGVASPRSTDTEEQDGPGDAHANAARNVSPARQLRRAADAGVTQAATEIQQPTAWHPSLSHAKSMKHVDVHASANPRPVTTDHGQRPASSRRNSNEGPLSSVSVCSSTCSDDQSALAGAPSHGRWGCSPCATDHSRSCNNLRPTVGTGRAPSSGTRSLQQRVSNGPSVNSGRRATSQRPERQRGSTGNARSDAGKSARRSCDRSGSAGPSQRRVRRGRRSTSSTTSVPETVSSLEAHEEHTPEVQVSRELVRCAVEKPRKNRDNAASQKGPTLFRPSSNSNLNSDSIGSAHEAGSTHKKRSASMQLICALAEIESTVPAEQEIAEIEDVFLAQTRPRQHSPCFAGEACHVDTSPPTPEYLWFGGSGEDATISNNDRRSPAKLSLDPQQLPGLAAEYLDTMQPASCCGSGCSPNHSLPAHGFEQERSVEALHASSASHACAPLTLADKLNLLSRRESWQDANQETKSAGVLRRRQPRQSSTSSQQLKPNMDSRCVESTSSSHGAGQCSFADALPRFLVMDDQRVASAEIHSTVVGRGRGRRSRARKAAKSAPPRAAAAVAADPWQTLAEEDAQSCEANSYVKVLRPTRSRVQQCANFNQHVLPAHTGYAGHETATESAISSRVPTFTERVSGPAVVHAELTNVEAEAQSPSVQTSQQPFEPCAEAESPATSSDSEQHYWDALGQWSAATGQRHACTKDQQKAPVHQGGVVRQEPPGRRGIVEAQPRFRKTSLGAAKPTANRRVRDRDACVVLGDPMGVRPRRESAGSPSEPPAGFWQNSP